MQRLNDRWMRLLGVPTLALLGQYMMYGYTNVPYPEDWRIPLFFVLGAIAVWEINRLGILLSRRLYPELAQTWKRILLQLIWFITFSSLIRISQTIIYQLAGWWHTEDTFAFSAYFFNTLVSVAGTIQIAAVFEGTYLYDRWKVSYTETQELKKASLQIQLDALKQQVNPHFLFNSLNALDSLIEDDPPKARVFLEELSTVYRYLLRSNEHHLTDLEKELGFIQSYFHLLKTRLGDGLQLNIAIDDRFQTYKIPPLTLQLLVENAFKHNVVLPDQPLVISICTDPTGHLLVTNNIQRKKTRVASNGVGLSNILNKYRILNHAAPSIREADGLFEVTLPLINTSQ